jgi:hypothetical protein
MRNLPKNAILITESDPDSFPIWYYHFGLDQRNDISVFVLPLTQFRWYQELQIRTYPGLNYPAVIPSFSNSSVSWGNEFEKLNNEKIICSNKIVRDDENKIVTTCSNGLTLEYILN